MRPAKRRALWRPCLGTRLGFVPGSGSPGARCRTVPSHPSPEEKHADMLNSCSRLPRLGLLTGVLALTACSVPMTRPFDRNDPESIRHYNTWVIPEEHRDYALHELFLGQVFFEQGSYEQADARFANACKVMERIEGDGQDAS